MSDRSALDSLRTRGFLGLCAAGVAGGCVAASSGGGGWFVLPVAGLVGSLFGCWGGGGLGMLAAMAFRALRRGGRKAAFSTEGGLVLSAYGAFLGTVVAMILGRGQAAHFWAMGGGVLGGAVAGGLGEGVCFLIRMLMLVSMTDADRAESVRRAARTTRDSLLWPGDDDLGGDEDKNPDEKGRGSGHGRRG